MSRVNWQNSLTHTPEFFKEEQVLSYYKPLVMPTLKMLHVFITCDQELLLRVGGGIAYPIFHLSTMICFIVASLVSKPLNRSEAKEGGGGGWVVRIQNLLLFKCKLLCYHSIQILVSTTARSPSATLQIKGLATKYTTVE